MKLYEVQRCNGNLQAWFRAPLPNPLSAFNNIVYRVK